MRLWIPAAIALATAACGGAQSAQDPAPAAASPAAAPAGSDARTAIERRRDAACDALGPRITACAVADARADLAAGKIDQQQFAKDTAPEIQAKNTEKFVQACKRASYSSRQVRVLEVCPSAESQCGPLLDCLGHLDDPAAK
jgi:hypothetical protein